MLRGVSLVYDLIPLDGKLGQSTIGYITLISGYIRRIMWLALSLDVLE